MDEVKKCDQKWSSEWVRSKCRVSFYDIILAISVIRQAGFQTHACPCSFSNVPVISKGSLVRRSLVARVKTLKILIYFTYFTYVYIYIYKYIYFYKKKCKKILHRRLMISYLLMILFTSDRYVTEATLNACVWNRACLTTLPVCIVDHTYGVEEIP